MYQTLASSKLCCHIHCSTHFWLFHKHCQTKKTDCGIECALTLLIIEYFYYNSLCSYFSFVNSSYNIVIIAKYFFQKQLWIATQENNVHTKDTYCKVSILNNQSHFSLTAEAEAPTWFEILVKFYLVLFGEKYMWQLWQIHVMTFANNFSNLYALFKSGWFGNFCLKTHQCTEWPWVR